LRFRANISPENMGSYRVEGLIMGNTIDITTLVNDMLIAVSVVIGKDIKQLKGFSKQQLKAIAQEARYVSEGIIDGSITADTKDFFLDSIEEMARNFAKTFSGMVTVRLETVWNSLVDIIWEAINAVTSFPLIVA